MSDQLVSETGFEVLSPNELSERFSGDADIDIRGVDVIVDCTGFPPALEQAIPWTRRGALICVFGCAKPGSTMK